MDAVVVPLIASVVGAVTGGLLVYGLSGRRAQKEWRAEKRAEVVLELYRLLSPVKSTAELATRPGAPLELRIQRIKANRKALEELLNYFHAHALWIEAESLPDIEPFVKGLSSALGPYEEEFNKGTLGSPLAVGAAEHVQRIVPEAREVLGAQFRAIVYPKSWREHLASFLEWLETRNWRSAERVADSSNSEERA